MECSFDDMLQNIREEKNRHVEGGPVNESRTLTENNMTNATAFQVINMFGYNVALSLSDTLEKWLNDLDALGDNKVELRATKTPERSQLRIVPRNLTDQFRDTFGKGAELYFLVSPDSSTEFSIRVTTTQVTPNEVYEDTFSGESPANQVAMQLFDHLKVWATEKVIEILEQ